MCNNLDKMFFLNRRKISNDKPKPTNTAVNDNFLSKSLFSLEHQFVRKTGALTINKI